MANDNSTLSALLDPGIFGPAQTKDQVTSGAITQIDGLTAQLQQLETVSQALADSTKANTQAVDQNTAKQEQGRASTGSLTGSTVEGALGLGLGLGPLISGLVNLFGASGSSSIPAALVDFGLPPSIRLSAGGNEASPDSFAVDYGQGGQPRPVTVSAPAQITVQVQAMDAQSFLDHSNEIAMAVRQAMLESSVLNDVIREV